MRIEEGEFERYVPLYLVNRSWRAQGPRLVEKGSCLAVVFRGSGVQFKGMKGEIKPHQMIRFVCGG
jgi:hypothetical protein